MVLLIRLFAEIVKIIFLLVSQVMLIIMDLSQYNFFSSATIKDFTQKVYVVIGVLMLFKLVISAVQYLVNPDMFDDKSKGLGAIIRRSMVAVALLVLTPTIFKYALEIQSTVVESIPKIIFGQNSVNSSQISSVGDSVSITVVDSFLMPKNGKNPTKTTITKAEEVTDVILDGCGGLFDDIWGEKCVYSPIWLLSIPIGVYLIFILVSMAIDIATRTIKLGIIQILAPVPIVNYVTDEKKLHDWFKTTMQVYVDLFIRMAVILFVIYFVDKILKDTLNIGNVASDLGRTPGVLEFALIKIFIIIALLLFAKNAPKFICDLIGLEGAGESMGDMFKRAGGLLGTAVSGYKTARSNYTTQKERALGKGMTRRKAMIEGLRSAAAGATSATGRGLLMTGQGKGFNDVRQGAFKNAISARNRRNDRIDNLYNTNVPEYIKDASGNWIKNPEYYGVREYRRDVKREKFGIPTNTAFTKVKYDVVDKIAQDAGAEKSFGATKMNETPRDPMLTVTRNIDGTNYDFSIATARSYASIQVGTKAKRWDNKTVIWSVDDQARAMQIQQEVEKRASYLKVADLIANNDPTAKMNRDKTRLEIENNRTSIDSDTLKTVYTSLFDSFKKSGKSTDEIETILGTKDSFSVDKVVGLLRHDPVAGDKDSIGFVADILTGVKDGFERARTEKYAQAQAADARAKKTQEAINNNNEKKG